MSTIYVKKETKKELSRIAGELQAKLGRKIDFDKAIQYLIKIYRSRNIKRKALIEFLKPIEGITFEEAYKELIEERKRDERDI